MVTHKQQVASAKCFLFYVSGCFLSVQATNLEAAGVKIQPLKHGVIFVKERDIVLTNNAWRVAINLDRIPYEEAISKIREDLMLVEIYKKEFTSIAELRQIEMLLNTMEFRLNYFYQLLLTVDPVEALRT